MSEPAATTSAASAEALAPEPAGPNQPAIQASTIPPDELERLSADIVSALKTVYDPEIPADIYEIGRAHV